jgi:hypothetical protein
LVNTGQAAISLPAGSPVLTQVATQQVFMVLQYQFAVS